MQMHDIGLKLIIFHADQGKTNQQCYCLLKLFFFLQLCVLLGPTGLTTSASCVPWVSISHGGVRHSVCSVARDRPLSWRGVVGLQTVWRETQTNVRQMWPSVGPIQSAQTHPNPTNVNVPKDLHCKKMEIAQVKVGYTFVYSYGDYQSVCKW